MEESWQTVRPSGPAAPHAPLLHPLLIPAAHRALCPAAASPALRVAVSAILNEALHPLYGAIHAGLSNECRQPCSSGIQRRCGMRGLLWVRPLQVQTCIPMYFRSGVCMLCGCVTVAVGKCFFFGVDAKGWRGDKASEKQLSVPIICRGRLFYLNLNNNLTVTHCCTQPHR